MARSPTPDARPITGESSIRTKIATPDEERGWPRPKPCRDCGLENGHAPGCPNG
jgi:hypothetical protein